MKDSHGQILVLSSRQTSELFPFRLEAYLAEIVDNVLLQKSIPAQNRQSTLYISNNKG